MTLTFTDVFCGAGGSSVGLEAAGFELKLAANHWDRAIETHSYNFPDADHLCADVSNYDMRRLPKTDIAWFSPECTWNSPAGGRAKRRAQLDMFEEYVPSAAEVRSRATMFDVIRATEVHRYAAVVVENVVEVTAWDLFDWWLAGMHQLGYRSQIVCVSSAHIGGADNIPAPQWRDRLYVVFTRVTMRRPRLRPRPAAWCFACDELVSAVQAWKRCDRRRIGKYAQQYLFRCPTCQGVVEPYVLPAAAAIDWSDIGERIGDRARPLAPATIRRIEAGLQMFAQPTEAGPSFCMQAAYGGHGGRHYRPDQDPLHTVTATRGDALVTPGFYLKNYGDISEAKYRSHPVHQTPLGAITTQDSHSLVTPPFMVYGYSGGIERRVKPIEDPLGTIVANGRGHHGLCVPEPFVTMLRARNRPCAVDEPLATLTTGLNHALTIPPGAFLSKHHGGLDYERIAHMNKGVEEPMGTVVARPNISLVIPYRRGRAKTTAEPLHTLATRESAALVAPAVEVNDCHFRMLKPREHLRGQRFPDSYVVKGNQGEQTMQAGNAVSSNVAQWLGAALAEVL